MEKKVPAPAEKRSKSMPKALKSITSSFSQKENAILQTILRRGLETEPSGRGSDRSTFEELKVLWKFIDKSKDNTAFILCEWCQKVYVLGEAIRGIHGKEHGAGKPCSDKAVHYGQGAVLDYLKICIEAVERTLNQDNDYRQPIKIDLPRMGLVRSTGKFESFPQSAVLWCFALEPDEAEERLASVIQTKPTWLKTMVERLRLRAGSTVKDVQEYLDKEKPRFLSTHPIPSEREIKFWIQVAGPIAAYGVPVSLDFKENLDVIVGRLGKRDMDRGRYQKVSGRKPDSQSVGSSESANLKVQEKPGPTFQSALSAILKKNGGRQKKQVVNEKDPEKKMKMVFRRLGGTEADLPPGDWTAGIDETTLSERLGAVKTFVGSFGLSLSAAVRLLSSGKASRPASKKRKGALEEVYCVPGSFPGVNKLN